MKKQLSERIQNTLRIVLNDSLFSKKTTLNSAKIEHFLSDTNWIDSMESTLFPINKRLTCAQILECCEAPLSNISPVPEEGWLSFSFQFAKNIMFPEQAFRQQAEKYRDGTLCFLNILQVLFDYERKALPFDPFMDFHFVPQEVLTDKDDVQKYGHFLDVFRKEFVYELMRLGIEVTPYPLLYHVAGVHYIAMNAARGLDHAGVPINLSLISTAAAGHDFGKFGCKVPQRVPYQHYYYTDQWFSSRHLNAAGRIAANHSTWDLELENLTAESLCLIYADFRVKQVRDEKGLEHSKIFSLQESFDVILNKLDNVDAAKKRRYEFVYGKLHDFEDYMRRLGIDVDFTGEIITPKPKINAALLDETKITEEITMRCIDHNLRLMHRMNSGRHFGNILEAAHSEKDWKKLRAYLNILEEYSIYLSQHQKVQMLSFCYELLMHKEGAIRLQAAELMGMLLAKFRLGYRKELPADVPSDPKEQTPFTLWTQFLDMLIYPDHKITIQQRDRIGYSAKHVIASLLENCQKQDTPYFMDAIMRYYIAPQKVPTDIAFVLLNLLPDSAFSLCSESVLDLLTQFAGYFCLNGNQLHLQVSALQFLMHMTDALPTDSHCRHHAGSITLSVPYEDSLSLTFLQCHILQNAGIDASRQEHKLYKENIVNEIFRENLKPSVHWSVKIVNIELLMDQVKERHLENPTHIAAHLANLIRISEWAVVRDEAGSALVDLIPMLEPDQRTEIVLELTRSLEGSEYEFSKEIPAYLGRLALYLDPESLEGLIRRLQRLSGSSNLHTVSGALGVVGAMLASFPSYQTRFPQSKEIFDDYKKRLMGLLLSGLAHFQQSVQQESLLIIGKTIFASPELSNESKADLFSLSAKKILFLLDESPENELSFLYRAAAFSHIYRFLSFYRLDHKFPVYPKQKKIAFFPGTFDPFTLSHKEIVRKIRNLGFEVFLAIDEFSWSKKTQPHLIRREIAKMSIADEFNVYLFPDEIPVNIANPNDLKHLKDIFFDKNLYMVVGSDVVRNASSYHTPPSENSIHSMNHIIFSRLESGKATASEDQKAQAKITGEMIHLHLPDHLEDISSTKIRDNIDLNRDISNLIDPIVKDFIYENNLYLREPPYKPLESAEGLHFQEISSDNQNFVGPPEKSILLLNSEEKEQLLGDLTMSIISPSDLFDVLHDLSLSDQIRRRTSGKILLITGVHTLASWKTQNIDQLLLSEALSSALRQHCGFALFLPRYSDYSPDLISTLRRLGFAEAGSNRLGVPCMAVDMHAPIVLIQNLETTIKEPLSSSPELLKTIGEAHNRLLLTLTELYPGNLVLPFSAEIIYHRLVEKITAANNVPNTVTIPRTLGKSMCVPFGKILRGKVIPNTVTKTLHTDKVFSPDSTSSRIEAFPHYTPIESQVRCIKSFDRPVILVDDLIHEGDRIRALDPIFRRQRIPIQEVLVGILSARGRDLMKLQGHPVDSVYYIPNLRQWFVESTLYPFIGGDTVHRSSNPVPGLQPSINRFLPYAIPEDSGEYSKQAIFSLSRCCIENAIAVFRVLESQYREKFSRNLTLNRLTEAIILPLCPDKGSRISYDPNLPVTSYLQNDLEMLMRMQNLMI